MASPVDRLLSRVALVAALSAAGAVAPSLAAEIAYVPAGKVDAAFAKGGPLVEQENYKVHASRRDGPGEAEVHLGDTDTIRVVEGEAAFVVGGELVDGREVSPGEIRGPSVKGGRVLNLKPGDVVVVPHGTPHWFREVRAPFLYYVVKVAAER